MGLKPGTRECPVPYKHHCAMPEIGPLWGMIRHVEPRTYYQKITVSGEILGNNAISKKDIVLEFLP